MFSCYCVYLSLCFIAALVSSTFLFFCRCPVFRRLKEEAERRKRPSWNEIKGRKGDGETPGDAKHSSLSRNPTREAPEPGMINPAFEENEDGKRRFGPLNNIFFFFTHIDAVMVTLSEVVHPAMVNHQPSCNL